MNQAEHHGGTGWPGRSNAAASPLARTVPSNSIRSRLVRLVLVLLIPALLLAGVLLWSLEQESARTQERQLAATARTLALVVDGRIAEQVATLRALSVSPRLARGDWAGFTIQARRALEESDSWIVVSGPDGQLEVNTFSRPGVRVQLPRKGPGSEAWSGWRGGARISNVIWGPAADQPVIVVTKRVVLDDGRAIELGVVTRAASFSHLLARQDLPPRWTAGILDGQRRLVGLSRGGERYIGRQAAPDMQAAIAARPRGILARRTLEGMPVIAAFDQLPGYGWTAVVSMPRDEAIGAVRKAMLVGVIVGALLLTAAFLLALRMGRRIAEPVETVARAASEWVAGGSPTFPTATGLAETDGLGRAFAAALQAVEQRDRRHNLLINELNHRVKNTLATVQSIALHTRKAAGSIGDYHAALEGRVIAMSRAHEILTRSAWTGAELGVLAHETLDAFAGPQLRIEGPPTQVGPTDALNLALILYELATNASKHGALSQPGGQVRLSWRRLEDQTRVVWVETGGPTVTPPTRKGFGSRLITRATEDLQPSDLSFAPEGVRCEFTLRAAA